MKSSLSKSMSALGSAIVKMFLVAPGAAMLIFVMMLFLMYVSFQYWDSFHVKLSLITIVVSVIHYVKTKNYAETILTFMLAMLTIYSIEWSGNNAYVFATFLIALLFALLYVASLKLHMNFDREIGTAATRFGIKEFDANKAKIKQIALNDSQLRLLKPTDKATICKLLAFSGVPIVKFQSAINEIEQIELLYGSTFSEAIEFYQVLYLLQKQHPSQFKSAHFLNEVTSKSIPMHLEGLIKLLKAISSNPHVQIINTAHFVTWLSSKLNENLDLNDIITAYKNGYN